MIYKLNSVGDKQSPWRTPQTFSNHPERSDPFNSIHDIAFVRSVPLFSVTDSDNSCEGIYMTLTRPIFPELILFFWKIRMGLSLHILILDIWWYFSILKAQDHFQSEFGITGTTISALTTTFFITSFGISSTPIALPFFNFVTATPIYLLWYPC